jgi:iron complex outermembrane recepter protein
MHRKSGVSIYLRSFRLGMSFSVLAAATVFAQQASAQTMLESAVKIEEIIVTGQKLSQSLQDTPNSVVVATGKELDQPAYRDVEDFLRGVPNVVFTSGGQLPTVRGIDGNGVALGGTGAVSGGRPRLTTYVDSVPRSFSFLPNGVPVTWDIGQLEFYRGAQSTTLGRNAVVGALVIKTTDPQDRFGGAAEIGIRSENISYNGAMTLNVPIVDDRLALRVSADGYTGDNFINYVGPLAPKADFISKDEGYRLRAKLAFRPKGFNDNLSFRLAYEKQYARRPSPEDATQLSSTRARDQANPGSISVFKLSNELVSFEANVSLSDSVTAYAIASYQDSKESGVPIFDDGSSLDVFANSKEYTQEGRVTYAPAGSRFQLVGGIFHFSRNRIEGGVPGSAFVYDATDKANTIAVFADSVIPVGNVDIIAGARWEREQQKRNFLAVFGLGLDVDIRQSIFLPKAGLRWNISSDQSITALYYRGYSPAAAAVSFASFSPYEFSRETADNAELAWRSDYGKLTFNANLFASWYQGQQLFGNGPLGVTDSIVVNAARTRYLGAESNVIWQVMPSLSVTAAIGVLDTKIIRFGGDASNDLNNGNDLPFSPSVTGRLAAAWKPVEKLSLDVDARYSAARFSTYVNALAERLDSHVLLDMRASYDFGAVSVYAYVENLFNRFYVTSKDVAFDGASVGRPRTFGVALRGKF